MIRALVFMLLMAACSQVAIPAKVVHPPKPSKLPRSELVCMAWVIDSEARGESPRGQRAVLDVVKRRMVVRKLSACGVVKQPSQFSGYKRGSHLIADALMMQRLERISRMEPVVPKAEYFHATYVKPSWAARMKLKLKIGRHVFFERKPKQKEKQK